MCFFMGSPDGEVWADITGGKPVEWETHFGVFRIPKPVAAEFDKV